MTPNRRHARPWLVAALTIAVAVLATILTNALITEVLS